jgi:hypothetical protein
VPSYSPVFSQPFVQYTASTPNPSFEVPAGFTAVVRQISCSQEITDWLLNVSIQDSEAAPAMVIFSEHQAGIETYVAGQGRWVVPEGGIISIYLSSLGEVPAVYVGGYLLRNTLT